jgi:hypothetical protein
MFYKRSLQIAVMIACLVPLSAGLGGVWKSIAIIDTLPTLLINTDSHFRYLSGLLLGIGLGFFSCIPHIETKTERFLLLSLIVVIGGLSRLYGLIIMGVPDNPMLFGLGMELFVVPLLAALQLIVAHKFARL